MSKFKDLIAGAIFLCLSLIIYIGSNYIRVTKEDPLGPQFFPRLVAFSIAALSIVLIVKGAAQLRAGKQKKGKKPMDLKSFLLTSAILIAYMLLVDKVGFILVSVAYLFLQIILITPKEDLTKRNYVIFGAASLVIPVGLYFVFYYAFNIFLPPGILG